LCKRKLIKKKVGSAALKNRCYFSKRECQLPSKFALYWGVIKVLWQPQTNSIEIDDWKSVAETCQSQEYFG